MLALPSFNHYPNVSILLILIKCYNLLLFMWHFVCVSLSIRWPLFGSFEHKFESADQAKMRTLTFVFFLLLYFLSFSLFVLDYYAVQQQHDNSHCKSTVIFVDAQPTDRPNENERNDHVVPIHIHQILNERPSMQAHTHTRIRTRPSTTRTLRAHTLTPRLVWM